MQWLCLAIHSAKGPVLFLFMRCIEALHTACRAAPKRMTETVAGMQQLSNKRYRYPQAR